MLRRPRTSARLSVIDFEVLLLCIEAISFVNVAFLVKLVRLHVFRTAEQYTHLYV